jgi:predicted DNA-binding transcriptional regulator YafY
MIATSSRLLRLLSLLQLRRDWTSTELAERLTVSTRTVRSDVARLRELGYPVEARPGVAGGYRLTAGQAMPPLVLDDDEAVAVAVGLEIAATHGLGSPDTALTALAKVEQVLPSRLRERVRSVREASSVVPGTGPTVEPGVLGALAAAIRAGERLRFGYTAHDGTTTTRHVEPHRLVSWGARWYLLAWDLDRDDWRVFRVDRTAPRPPTGARFRRREIPEDVVVEHVVDRVRRSTWRYRARLLVHAPAAAVTARAGAWMAVEEVGPEACRVELGADDPDRLALWVTQLDMDVEVLEGPELAAAFDRLAARFGRAARVRRTSS